MDSLAACPGEGSMKQGVPTQVCSSAHTVLLPGSILSGIEFLLPAGPGAGPPWGFSVPCLVSESGFESLPS